MTTPWQRLLVLSEQTTAIANNNWRRVVSALLFEETVYKRRVARGEAIKRWGVRTLTKDARFHVELVRNLQEFLAYQDPQLYFLQTKQDFLDFCLMRYGLRVINTHP